MRRFVILIISTFLLVGIASSAKSDETIIYTEINTLNSNVDSLVERNITGFSDFGRSNAEGLDLLDLRDNISGFAIEDSRVNDLILDSYPETLPEFTFYYGHVVECDGLMGRCLIIEDKLKIYLPNTDFMSTQDYWEWRGCQYRSVSREKRDIIMGHTLPFGVTIEAYCPEHEGYQHASFLYSEEHGIIRISMYTTGEYGEWFGEITNLFLVNQKGFLAQD